MTKPYSPPTSLSKRCASEERKEMMRLMAETSYNPANVVPSKQEELAMFMVRQLHSFHAEPHSEGGTFTK